MTKTLRKFFSCFIMCFLTCFIFIHPAISDESANEEIPSNQYGIRSTNPYVVDRFLEDGKLIDEVIVPSMPHPPEGITRQVAMVPEPRIDTATNTILNVPAMTWVFGCSATTAAMMFGHYDRMGYSNMYAGPTNSGVFPMTNETWGTVVINGETRALCPLSATRQNLDGRAIRGHVDDYWIVSDNPGPDPFVGNWAEHAHGECTGDYMGTNQSSFSNIDGGTRFFYFEDGSPLYDYTGAEPDFRDGCHGLRLFAESRGYTVDTNYSQYIEGYNGNTQGFTFDDFKAEIVAGRPVLIHVVGHTMLGYGYDDIDSTIYIHDTWDYLDHSMTWGGSYSGLAHYGVTVFSVDPLAAPPASLTVPGSDSDGSYTVSWGASSTSSVTYVLEEATNSSFTSGVRTAYSGTSLSTTITGRSSGSTYYYRIKATRSGYIDSDWRTNPNGCAVSADVNLAPTLDSIGNQSVDEGDLLELTITASDPDGDDLSFSESNIPSGATLTDHGNGSATFRWQTAIGDAGIYNNITFTVTDDGTPALNDSETISIDVGDDNDGDGVPDGEEQGPLRNDPAYDGNGDGIPDSQQNNVVSCHSHDGQEYVTLACSQPISSVVAMDNPSQADSPSGIEFPYGFFEFTIILQNPGDSAIVTLYLPAGANPSTYYRYGPTPSNATDHWYEYLYDGQTGAEINGNVITLHFVDGIRGDDDLAVNGTIIDAGGPGAATQGSGGGGGGGSSGGGCFIGTAALGN